MHVDDNRDSAIKGETRPAGFEETRNAGLRYLANSNISFCGRFNVVEIRNDRDRPKPPDSQIIIVEDFQVHPSI